MSDNEVDTLCESFYALTVEQLEAVERIIKRHSIQREHATTIDTTLIWDGKAVAGGTFERGE